MIERSAAAPVLVLQHEGDCPPGWLDDVLDEVRVDAQVVLLHEGAPVPREGRWSGVASLGGSMGAYQEAEFPFLTEENRPKSSGWTAARQPSPRDASGVIPV